MLDRGIATHGTIFKTIYQKFTSAEWITIMTLGANHTVHIDLGTRSYDIHIGAGLLAQITSHLPEPLDGRSLFIVSDKNTAQYAETVINALSPFHVQSIVLPAGEATKSFASYQNLCEWLLGNGVNRNSIIFAVGGGVIGDLAGYAAASTMRGIDFVQVPTTILAQVDSSVGGKTGINTPQGKNLVGAFYQPKAVIADLDVLQTLPKREILAGYAEIAKYGLINDPAFFEWLEDANGQAVCKLEQGALIHAIKTSVKAKAAIVQQDEREGGVRALLNLGHTFGHALEAAAGYDGTLLHGEAVAIGMVMAFDCSVKMGLCSAQDADRVRNHLQSIGLPVEHSINNVTAQDLIETMKRDKKVVSGKMNFILARGIGQSFLSDEVTQEILEDILS